MITLSSGVFYAPVYFFWPHALWAHSCFPTHGKPEESHIIWVRGLRKPQAGGVGPLESNLEVKQVRSILCPRCRCWLASAHCCLTSSSTEKGWWFNPGHCWHSLIVEKEYFHKYRLLSLGNHFSEQLLRSPYATHMGCPVQTKQKWAQQKTCLPSETDSFTSAHGSA